MKPCSRELDEVLAGLGGFARSASARIFGKAPNGMVRSGAVVVISQRWDLQR